MQAAADILSPELVLVSPPEVAAQARRLLTDPVQPVRRSTTVTVSRQAVAVFYAVCLAGTIGPLVLAYSVR